MRVRFWVDGWSDSWDFEPVNPSLVEMVKRSAIPDSMTIEPDGSLVVRFKKNSFKAFHLIAGVSLIPHLNYSNAENVRQWLVRTAIQFIPEARWFANGSKMNPTTPRTRPEDWYHMLARWVRTIETRDSKAQSQWVLDGWLDATQGPPRVKIVETHHKIIENPFRFGTKAWAVFLAVRESVIINQWNPTRSWTRLKAQELSANEGRIVQVTDGDVCHAISFFDPEHRVLENALKKYPKIAPLHGLIKFNGDTHLVLDSKLEDLLISKRSVQSKVQLTSDFSNLSRRGDAKAILNSYPVVRNYEGYPARTWWGNVEEGKMFLDDRPEYLREMEEKFCDAETFDEKLLYLEAVANTRKNLRVEPRLAHLFSRDPGYWDPRISQEVKDLIRSYNAYSESQIDLQEVLSIAEVVQVA